MENTAEIFKQYNLELKQNLIPNESKPIYCTSFEDVNDENYYPNQKLKN